MDIESQRIVIGTIAVIVLTLFWGTLFYKWYNSKLKGVRND